MKVNWKKLAKIAIHLIILGVAIWLLFCVNLNATIDSAQWLNTFKENSYWIASIIKVFSTLILFIFLLFMAILAKLKLSLSLSKASFAGFEVSLKNPAKLVKNNVRNFLSTKRSLFRIDEKYDNFCEVFDSYHSVYEFLRQQLITFDSSKKKEEDCFQEVHSMIIELNTFLTKNQSNFRRWCEWYNSNQKEYKKLSEFQNEYPDYDKLMSDFKTLNDQMKKHISYFDIKVIDLCENEAEGKVDKNDPE